VILFRRTSINFALFSLSLDIVLTYAAVTLAIFLRVFLHPLLSQGKYYPLKFDNLLYLIILIVWAGTFLSFSIYDPKRRYRITDEIPQLLLAIGFSALVFAGILYIGFREVSRYMFAIFIVADVLFLVGWRLVYRGAFRLLGTYSINRRVLLVGAGSQGQRVYNMMIEYAGSGLEVVGYIGDRSSETEPESSTDLPLVGYIEDVPNLVETLHVDDVIIALPRSAYEKMSRLVHRLHELPVHIRIVPDYFSLALFRATAEEFSGIPMINLRDPALNEVQRLAKRILDVLGSTLLLLVASPLMIVVGFLVWLDSPGSIFYKQKRVGENGRVFGMYKFRSMVVDADKQIAKVLRKDENGNMIHKSKNDPRVTKIGKFIRRSSLDELPQLLNVFTGEMSLVGPRPEMPWMIENYEPWQLKRLSVPQGITGWWQVNGRSDKPMHLHTEEDLYYIQNYTLWMDIYIILKTPWVILRGKGAY
jgi:exopolysaccharide biosynthesis polyprenyl glycosylphosphotransferase